MSNSQKKIAGYLRVSTDLQEKSGYSLEDQKQRFLKFVNGREYEIYQDVASGSRVDRDAYQELLQDLKRGVISDLWIVEFTRIGRSNIDLLILQEALIEADVSFYIDGQIQDFSSLTGDLHFGINSVIASYERKRLRERLARGKNASVRKGNKIFSPDIYGYDKVYDPNLGKTIPKQNMDEVDVIRKIFGWFINEQLPFKQIAERLNDLRIPTKRGSVWESSGVRHLLKHTVYAGWYQFGDERVESRYYPAIISEEDFSSAQERASHISKDYDQNIRYNYHQSSSLLYCWHCKQRMIFHHKKWKTPKTGNPRYRDIYKINHAKGCNRNVRTQAVKEPVLDYIMTMNYTKLLSDRDSLLRFQEEQIENQKRNNGVEQAALVAIEKQLEKKNREKESLYDLYAKSDVARGDPSFMKRLETVAADINHLSKQRDEKKKLIAESHSEIESAMALFTIDALNSYDAGNAFSRRTILKKVIQDAYIKDRIVHVEFITGKSLDTDLDNLPEELQLAVDDDEIRKKEQALITDLRDMAIDYMITADESVD